MEERILIDLLVQLGACEEARETAAHTVHHHTEREQHLRELQAEYEEDAAEAADGERTVAVRLRLKEAEIRTAAAALALKNDRIVGLSDRRQFQALQLEIAGLEQVLADLESEALLLVEAEDAARAATGDARGDAARQAGRGEREAVRLHAESEAAARAGADHEVEIARLLALLPPAVRRHVERLHGGGRRAVVWVAGGACGGCFGQLPAQQAIDADKGKSLVRCAGCARYVVHRPWNATASS